MNQPSSNYIFVSYSHDDDDVVNRVVKYLRTQGITVWVDNEGLRPGEDSWSRAVERAVKNASAIVAVLSPSANDSKWVEREIALAQDNDKTIIPILIKGDKQTSIPFRLNTYQRIDMRADEKGALSSLLIEVSRYVDKKASAKNANAPARPEKPFEPQQRPTQASPRQVENKPSGAENLLPLETYKKWKAEPSLKTEKTSADLGQRFPYQSRVRSRLNTDPKYSAGVSAPLKDRIYGSELGTVAPSTSTAQYTPEPTKWPIYIIYVVLSIVYMFLANWAVYWLFSRFGVVLPEIRLHALVLLVAGLAWGAFTGFVTIIDEFYETYEALGIGCVAGGAYLIGLGIVYGLCYAGNHFFGVPFGTLFYWVFGAANVLAFLWRFNDF